MATPQLTEIAAFYQKRFGFKAAQISAPLHADVQFIIVIPCYNEPALLTTLQSLSKCDTPDFPVEVIVVINESTQTDKKIKVLNRQTEKEAKTWIADNTADKLKFHILYEDDLPPKHAGVGLARKIGMDEALYRFASVNKNGLIVCLDADCTVEKNYLQELEKQFLTHHPAACNIYFEHDLDRVGDKKLREGIIRYELFLRYYVNGLRYTGFPFAFHTIGSSMGVRADVFAKSGGMNRRKAGEDFYFLHKVAPFGDLLTINSTTVYPSARISDRVPFGTGKAQSEWLQGNDKLFSTYNHLIFKNLKVFISSIDILYEMSNEKTYKLWLEKLPEAVQNFLLKENFKDKLAEIRQQTGSQTTFQKRFYAWFDGFKVLKFVHFARDNYYPQQPVEAAAPALLGWLKVDVDSENSEDLLLSFRKLDKEGYLGIME